MRFKFENIIFFFSQIVEITHAHTYIILLFRIKPNDKIKIFFSLTGKITLRTNYSY